MRRLWQIARAALLAYLCLVLIAMFFEDGLIFIPAAHPSGEWNPPGLAIEDAWFPSADGTRLHGWYVEVPNARDVVLFCHGNAGNVTHRASVLAAMRHEVLASTLVFDYRGYGRSQGRPNEAGVLADARAARAWLAARAGIPEGQIVLMGESIGGAVAVDLAARDGARALILESTFTSLADVASYHYFFLPIRWAMRTQLDSLGKIRNYHGPLLAVHGDADRIVPLSFGRRLFEAANEPKQWLLLRGHDHNDPKPASYYRAVRTFLDGIAASKATGSNDHDSRPSQQ